MNSQTRFMFRVDASSDIGVGHFMRCIAFAQQLQDCGITPIFLTKTDIPFLLERAKYENIEIIYVKKSSNMNDNPILVKNIAKKEDIHWLVLDGCNFLSQEYQKVVRGNGRKLLCIDDLADNHFLCDAIINQNAGAERLRYSCEPHTRLYLGTKYLLVKREYRNLHNWQRPIRKRAENILITMGGGSSGSTDAMLKVVEAVNCLHDSSLKVKMVLGTGFQNCSDIRNLIKQSNSNFELLPLVYNMLNLMKWADLVITAAGSTVWELILTNAPMVVLTIADNQQIIDRFLKDNDIAQVIGGIENVTIEEITKNIRDLIESEEQRCQLSSNCKVLAQNEFSFFDPILLVKEHYEDY